MARRRIDPALLPDQFGGTIAGTTLILDGDSACYVIAAKVKTMPTAIRHFQMEVLKLMFLTKTEDAIVHLTAMESLKAGRGNILAVKPYQGNRKGKAKPPLLEPIRQAAADPENWLPEYRVEYHYNLEADDGCMMDAYRLGDKGIMVSDDKDLRLTPYPYYDRKTGKVMAGAGFGEVWDEYTEGGTFKCMGLGRKFFWAQMLMGDSADNVAGLKRFKGELCGPVTALRVLSPIHGEENVANAVLDAYRAIDQNPLPEGWLMWLLRWPGDNFWNYLMELGLSKANHDFLVKCRGRVWFKQSEEKDDDRE